MKHLLDTSALCAHFLGQSGGDGVRKILEADAAATGVCVITWFEMHGVLRRCGLPPRAVAEALTLYRSLPLASCPVSSAVVDKALELRLAAGDRLALADALIAGCAASHGAVLVHRDQHFHGIPAALLRQQAL